MTKAKTIADSGYSSALENLTQTVTSSATTSINLASGLIINLTHNTNITTLTFSNVPTVCSVRIIRTKDNSGTSRTIAWPAAVNWISTAGTTTSAPTLLQTASVVQIFELFTSDGGTTFYGKVLNSPGGRDVGTNANNLVALDSNGKLPAVDGSQLTGVAGAGFSVGTNANNLVQLDSNAKLPAVDGSQLTNIKSTPGFLMLAKGIL